jgi:hypothetical protein
MWSTNDLRKEKEIAVQEVEVSKENTSFHIRFDARESELVDYFVLDLGEIVIDDKSLKLPLLQYRKGSKYFFILLAIGTEALIVAK